MTRLRPSVLAGILMLVVSAAACGDDDALTLDLDTLDATASQGTFRAEPVAGAYVAAVDDDLFIAVVLDGEDVAEEPQSVTVYLCDGDQVSEWLSGEVTPGEPVVLGGGVSPRVELTVADDIAAGTVAVWGRAARPFTALPATGDAGLYRAEEMFAHDPGELDEPLASLAREEGLTEVAMVGGWIVLEDGRQRGSANHLCPPLAWWYCAGQQ